MCTPRRHGPSNVVILNLLSVLFCVCLVTSCDNEVKDESALDRELKNYVDRVLDTGEFHIIPGVVVEEVNNGTHRTEAETCDEKRSKESLEEYVQKKLQQYSKKHVLSVNLERTARFFNFSKGDESASGKSSFLMGFGMGFFAFFLKKLLLPVFIGAQLVKSVLIAMFLPSILGGVGKLVGKGLSTFSGLSGASAGNNNQQQVEDFEFKDTDPYNAEPGLGTDFNGEADTINGNSLDVGTAASTNSRLGFMNQRIYSPPQINDNYYLRRPNKKTDYKVFHKIPSSSLLLTSYDPFYSPLLSRLDAVFQQLGLGNAKAPEVERCRERLVCLMYSNPAKYAPYSNLVSAQLSRELNELRKPSSENPEILRFFKYMKAAKDGQDGQDCMGYTGCPSLQADQPSPALLNAYNEINKLVQARKL